MLVSIERLLKELEADTNSNLKFKNTWTTDWDYGCDTSAGDSERGGLTLPSSCAKVEFAYQGAMKDQYLRTLTGRHINTCTVDRDWLSELEA